jgi:hypothetical protein
MSRRGPLPAALFCRCHRLGKDRRISLLMRLTPPSMTLCLLRRALSVELVHRLHCLSIPSRLTARKAHRRPLNSSRRRFLGQPARARDIVFRRLYLGCLHRFPARMNVLHRKRGLSERVKRLKNVEHRIGECSQIRFPCRHF